MYASTWWSKLWEKLFENIESNLKMLWKTFNYWNTVNMCTSQPNLNFKIQSVADWTRRQKNNWRWTITFTFTHITISFQTGPHSPYSPHPSSESQLPPNFNGGFTAHLTGPNGHLGGQNGHLGGQNGHLPGGLSSHMPGGPNSHLPPSYPSPSQQQLPPALSTLNVTNPRYAAK